MKQCNSCTRRNCNIVLGISNKSLFPEHRDNYKGISAKEFQMSCQLYKPYKKGIQTLFEATVFKNPGSVLTTLNNVGLKVVERSTYRGYDIIPI